MNEKDNELIKSLSALFNKLKKLVHIGSAFFHHHMAFEEGKEREDSCDPFQNPGSLKNSTNGDDTAGENAIGSILKNEKLTGRKN